MKVLLSWLREFAPIEGDPDQIAAQLTELGMELESVAALGEGLGGIVVARVLEVRDHPDADRIRLVDVDAGDGNALQICCGASNMVAGDLVPLATIGTVMPGGMAIAKRKMRGQESNGMLCSAREMELGDDHAGILVLPAELVPGTPITEALGISTDVVYEFDALPNRPDTLSILGVARDLAAHQGVPFAVPPFDPVESGADATQLGSVRIDSPDLCGRFLTRVLSGIELGPSPRWMAQRLIAAGMRPINNVVDVSNYVMLELGQPNHTYDLATLPGGVLCTRWARDGEVVETLDGVERTLSAADGVIVDRDDRVIGIAGVMGGASTEISATTTDVVLEMAWWDPEAIAATSTRLNLHSEASLRYKRGVDPEIAPLAARRFAQLLSEIAGATLHPGSVQAEGELPARVSVHMRTDRTNATLGTSLTSAQMAALIEPIGYACASSGDDLVVTVPTWRPDSTIEVDIVEEVGRHFGFSRIPKTVPASPHTGELSPRQRDKRTLRRALLGAGLSEAMPMPFLAPGDLERCGLPAEGLVLSNPLAAEESILRTSLLPGLVKAVAYNESHRLPGAQLFELGRVFEVGERGVITDVVESELAGRVLSGESEHLAAVLAGRDATAAVELVELMLRSVGRWHAPASAGASLARAEAGAARLEAAAVPGLHPGRSALVVLGDVRVGEVGEVDPGVLDAHAITERIGWVRLDLSTLLDLPASVPQARAVSRFPSSDIDLAFVVPESLPAEELRRTLLTASELVEPVGVELFDVFRSDQLGDGHKSLAFRLRFQEPDRTLTDTEVAAARDAIIAAAESRHGATLRG
jgi:phenylalanyl-tRNA synthetase beta chain